MMRFTHGLSAVDYCEMVRTVGDAVDLLIGGGHAANAESAVGVIARLGVMPVDELDVVRVVAHEMFSRTVH